jgi:hypothetical protein
MKTATATDVSWLKLFQTEWRILRACRHNVLLRDCASAPPDGPLESDTERARERTLAGPLRTSTSSTDDRQIRAAAGARSHRSPGAR